MGESIRTDQQARCLGTSTFLLNAGKNRGPGTMLVEGKLFESGER